MKTEYKFGLDKNRRELSYYQSAEWCRHISGLPRKKPNLCGENQSNTKLRAADVLFVRSFAVMPRALASELAARFGVAVSYIYQLRKKLGGGYKKWPHLR
jgi:hypothetical protein